MAGVPKPVLDFLLRPATMTSRQHSGTKLSTRRGKLARDGNTTAAQGGYRYGGMVHALAAVRRIHPFSFAPNRHRLWKSGNTNK